MIDDFRGEFHHQLDDKSRLSIPRKFATRIKSEEEGRVVLTRGIDSCIWVYPHSLFDKLFEQIKGFSLFDPNAQRFLNTFFSGTHEDTLDKASRIIIPKSLKDYANITKDVVLVGSVGRIQLWSLENWEQHLTDNKDNK